MRNIITKDKLDRVIELFAGKSSAIVLGKGPTFEVPKVDCDDLIVCANTTVNFCARCDILVVNDVEVLKKLEKEKVEAVKRHPRIENHSQFMRAGYSYWKYHPVTVHLKRNRYRF